MTETLTGANLSVVRAELKEHYESLDGIQRVMWGWMDIGNPGDLHLIFDFIDSRVRDTKTAMRTYGFYSRVFLPRATPEEADLLMGYIVEQMIDHFEDSANTRLSHPAAAGMNWQVRLINRGGPPLQVGSERRVYRKDFYTQVETGVFR